MTLIERALCPVLVGREAELTVLEDALLSARRDEGSVVALAGEAGLGKTRLATELAELARRIDAQVLWGACTEAELALPYLPFVEAIGNYLARVDVQKLSEALGPVGGELAQLFPQLGTPAPAAADLQQGKLRMFEAILALLQIVADAGALLVVIEDLHWADASTRELLDYMTRRVKQMPMLVLATYRRDELHRLHPLAPVIQSWRRSRLAVTVDLNPLGPDGVQEMVRAIFDEKEVTPDFRDMLLERSDGNPFVLEEMLKDALDRGAIFRTASGWDHKAVEEMALPASVADNIMLRIERLERAQSDLLRAAAVLGRSFSYDALLQLTGVDEATMDDALSAFVRQQLVEDDPRSIGRYMFRHSLTREAIYNDIILPRRQKLHARAADVLQAAGAPAAEVAYQLVAAGDSEGAVPLCLAAAEEAFRKGGYEEVIDLYERALPHLRGVDHARAMCRIGEAHWGARGQASAIEYLESGVEALHRSGGAVEAARFRLVLGRCYWEAARPEDAQREYDAALAELERQGPSEDLALAYFRQGSMRVYDVDPVKAAPLLQHAIDVAEQAGADMPRVASYGMLGVAIRMQGRGEEGLRWIQRGFEEALKLRLFPVAEVTLFNWIVSLLQMGRINETAALLERFEELPPSPRRSWREELEGEAAFQRGEIDGALERIEKTVDLASQVGNDTMVRVARQTIGYMKVFQNDFDEARRLLLGSRSTFQRQDALEHAVCVLTYAMASGDFDAGDQALDILTAGMDLQYQAPAAADLVVAGLLVRNRLEDAERFVSTLTSTASVQEPIYGVAPVARLALAKGDGARARDLAQHAVVALETNGDWIRCSYARVLYAHALAALDRRDDATRELNRVLAEATERGALLFVNDAREAASKLDLTLDAVSSTMGKGQFVDSPVPVGERLVSVLFADVRGYTAMTNERVPAAMAETIAKLQRWAAAEVEHHRGVVDKFAGDAVMATFNVSGMSVDHALHALQTAIAIQDKAALAGLPVGVGIAVGAAIVGQLAHGANLSVLGETTNLAARLQSQAGAGEIVLSEEAYRRVKDWLTERKFSATPREAELKGFDRPVGAYVVKPW